MREGWSTAALGDLAQIRRGATWVKGDEISAPTEGFESVVGIAVTSSGGQIKLDKMKYVGGLGEQVARLQRDDIVMVMSNGNRDRIGNAYLVDERLEGMPYSTFQMSVRVSSKELHPGYLHCFLSATQQQDALTAMTAGSTGLKNLNLSQIKSFPIALPPLATQHRIVDLIGALDEAILAADSNTKHAGSLYSAIRDRAFANMVDGSIPLGKIATTRLGKMLSASLGSREAEAPYVRNANVQWNRLELDDLKTMPFSESDRIEFDLRCGDVLVCEGGEIGRALVLREDLPGVHFQKAIHRVRCGPDLHPDFLQAFLWYLASTGGLEDYSSGSTIVHLTGEKLRRLPIPIVSMDEQEALVAILNECLSAQGSSTDYAASLRSLRTNLLTALLSGEHEIPSSYDKHLGAIA